MNSSSVLTETPAQIKVVLPALSQAVTAHLVRSTALMFGGDCQIGYEGVTVIINDGPSEVFIVEQIETSIKGVVSVILVESNAPPDMYRCQYVIVYRPDGRHWTIKQTVFHQVDGELPPRLKDFG